MTTDSETSAQGCMSPNEKKMSNSDTPRKPCTGTHKTHNHELKGHISQSQSYKERWDDVGCAWGEGSVVL